MRRFLLLRLRDFLAWRMERHEELVKVCEMRVWPTLAGQLLLQAWYQWRLERHLKLAARSDAHRWYVCRLLALLDARPPYQPLRWRGLARLIREGW